MTEREIFEDRVTGCFKGLAAGDRNGGPIRMALIVADSLISSHAFDPKDVCARYLAWWRTDAFDTGPVFADVYTRVDKGIDVQRAVVDVHEINNSETAGCNPAHRCPPLALAGFLSESELEVALIEEAKLSHWHQIAGEGSAFVGLLCRYLILGLKLEDAVEKASKNRIRLLRVAGQDSSSASLSKGGFTPDAIGAGLYFVKSSNSFKEALTSALQFAGQANYCPVITGAVAGARWGQNGIDSFDVDVEIRDRLVDSIRGLISTWGR